MQSGFRQSRQTKDNILYLTQKVKEEFNKGKKMSVFIDIASAFDKVWHNGLLTKLISIKVPYYLTNIFMSFLCDRKFAVKVGRAVSSISQCMNCKEECVQNCLYQKSPLEILGL